MTSDLKPRRAKKRVNIKFYAALALLILVTYLFFMSSSGASDSNILKKSSSAASSITKGISGTPKEREKTENQASAKDKETHALVHEMKKQSADTLAAEHLEKQHSSKTTDNQNESDDDSVVSLAAGVEVANAAKDAAKKAKGKVTDAVDTVKTETTKLIKSAEDTVKKTTDDVKEKVTVADTTPEPDSRSTDSKSASTTKSKQGKSKGAAFDADDALNVLMETYEMIIFSKTYCPHSKRAKAVLETYDIRPKPLIYELDVEDHGPQLQAALNRLTSRSTVPNILVHGTSLGGADEVVAMDEKDTLVAKIRGLSDLIDITRKIKA